MPTSDRPPAANARSLTARLGSALVLPGPIWLFLMAACVLLIAVDVVRSLNERALILDQARRETGNLARSLAQQAEDAIAGGQSLLVSTVERLEVDGTSPAALERLRQDTRARGGLLRWVQGVYAYDETGQWVMNPDAGRVDRYSVADREYFIYHRDHPDRAMRIGRPVRSRSTGRWVVPLSQRVDHPDGRFAGVALVALDALRLKELYDTFGMGGGDVISLFAGDGTLLVRRPFLEDRIGTVVADVAGWGREGQPDGAALDGRSTVDGTARIAAWRKSLGGRLITVVGLERDQVLAGWRAGALRHLLGVLALCALICALGTRLWLQMRRRHQAELSAAALGAEHRLLADHGSDLLLKVRPGGVRVYASPACHRMLGYTPEEMLRITSHQAVHPDDLPRIGAILATGGSALGTYRLRRKDGSYVWVEATSSPVASPVASPSSAPAERLIVVRDVDHRVAAEAELRASEARYRMLAENASDMIFQLDLTFRRLYVSPASREILGFAPEELVGTRPVDMIHPDDSARVAATYRAVIAGQERASLVNRIRHRDGHHVWVEVQLRLLRDPDGAAAGIIGVMRDVTQRHLGEQREAETLRRLQATNKLLTRAEAMTHIGHWTFDLRLREVTWSDEVYRIYGRKLSQAPTLETALDGYHPEDRATVATLVQRAIQYGESFSFDLRVVRPDGEIRHVHSQGEPAYDDDGELVALMGTFQDVTERIKLERDLRQAQKMETIGRLAAGVAHDFNNLLQGILGGLELLRDEVVPASPADEYARIAMNSARRGADMTHHLLSYSGRQMLQPRLMRPGPVLQELRGHLQGMLAGNIRIAVSADDALPPIEIDPAHLHTALQNLCVNAAHAMPDGGTLLLEAGADLSGPVAWVTLAVVDTGIGMEPGTLAQVFDPFFTTKGLGGTGLGLSMVQGFARQSGGDVRIDSRPGQGTRVELRLPAAAHLPAPVTPAGPAAPQAGRRVLLVDDVSDVRVTTAAFLEGAGITVVSAASGQAALDILAGGGVFDALLTDYAMGEIDGVALIRLARQQRPDLPCIVMTGFAGVERSGLPDEVEVLRKPFQRRTLVEAVERAVSRAAAPSSPPPLTIEAASH